MYWGFAIMRATFCVQTSKFRCQMLVLSSSILCRQGKNRNFSSTRLMQLGNNSHNSSISHIREAMDKSEIKCLQERWDAQSTASGNAFLGGKGDPPFGSLEDGRVDLRGLAITQFVKNRTLESFDLSGVSLDGFGQFGMCSLIQCRFCHSQLPTNLGNNFTGCDFSSAKLAGAVLRGKFTDCDFASANLTSVMGDQVQFVRCSFTKTNFRKATLTHCSFEDCEFESCKFKSGSLAFSKFIRCSIPKGDLGNTLMEKVVAI